LHEAQPLTERSTETAPTKLNPDDREGEIIVGPSSELANLEEEGEGEIVAVWVPVADREGVTLLVNDRLGVLVRVVVLEGVLDELPVEEVVMVGVALGVGVVVGELVGDDDLVPEGVEVDVPD